MAVLNYLTIKADIEGAREIAGVLRLMRMGDGRVRKVCTNAINRSLAHMRSLISAEIRDIYYVKKNVLDKGIHIHAAQKGRLEGSLSFMGFENPPLGQFSPRKGKTYISVRVLKAHRARRIQPGGEKKIVATSKGRAAVWLAKGQVMARTEGAKMPIVLYGPSFMAFFRRPNVVKALNIEAERYYGQRLKQEIDHYFRQAMI